MLQEPFWKVVSCRHGPGGFFLDLLEKARLDLVWLIHSSGLAPGIQGHKDLARRARPPSGRAIIGAAVA
jgi:hypothetical protein